MREGFRSFSQKKKGDEEFVLTISVTTPNNII